MVFHALTWYYRPNINQDCVRILTSTLSSFRAFSVTFRLQATSMYLLCGAPQLQSISAFYHYITLIRQLPEGPADGVWSLSDQQDARCKMSSSPCCGGDWTADGDCQCVCVCFHLFESSLGFRENRAIRFVKCGAEIVSNKVKLCHQLAGRIYCIIAWSMNHMSSYCTGSNTKMVKDRMTLETLGLKWNGNVNCSTVTMLDHRCSERLNCHGQIYIGVSREPCRC